MKKLGLAAAIAAALPLAASANTTLHTPGPMLTLGAVSTPQTLNAVRFNPAAGELVVRKDESVRFGVISQFGGGMEFGQVDNFVDDIDRLIDELDKEDLTLEDFERISEDFDDVLVKLGADGYMKMNGSASVPLFPLAIRSDSLGGVIVLDMYGAGQIATSFLDSPLTYDPFNQMLDTESAAYIKSAGVFTASLGYSRPLFEIGEAGSLLAGVRANYYQMSLSKQVVGLTSIDEDDDLGDVIADDFDKNMETTGNFGVDLGLIWEAPYYQVGATFYNINEPEFEYGEIGANCNELSGNSQANCFSAQTFRDEIDLVETHVMDSQVVLEGAVQTRNRHWVIAGSYALSEVRDPVGDEYQYATASATYFSDSAWIPSLRVGYRKNLVGSELSTLNLGLTLFGGVHFDLAYGLETIEIDGEEGPRTFAINLGLEERF